MSKRILSVMLISVLILSSLSFSLFAVDKPVVSLPNIICPETQNTTDLIVLPVRVTAFDGKVTTLTMKVTFDNTQVEYVKITKGNIPTNSEMVPSWSATPATTANANGRVSLMFSDATMGDDAYVNDYIIPGTQDIMYNLNFKRKTATATGSNIVISQYQYDYDDLSTKSLANGDLIAVNGSITFPAPQTASPTPVVTEEPPTASPTPVVTEEPTTPPTPSTRNITISIDETKGMVLSSSNQAIKDGEKVTINNGESATFKVISYGGYSIKDVTFGGVPQSAGMFKTTVNTGSVTNDATLAVSFDTFNPGDPQVELFDKVWTDGNSSVSYGTVRGDKTGAVSGIIVWNTAIAGTADVTLDSALANTAGVYLFSATTGLEAQGINSFGHFGLKVNEMTNGVYKMRTYVEKGNIINYGQTIDFTIGA